jgi:hypothetical protein
MPKLHLLSDDWSPGVEHIEMSCVVRLEALTRCRVTSALNAEREAVNWAFDYARGLRLAPRDRHGDPTTGRTFLLTLDLRPSD